MKQYRKIYMLLLCFLLLNVTGCKNQKQGGEIQEKVEETAKNEIKKEISRREEVSETKEAKESRETIELQPVEEILPLVNKREVEHNFLTLTATPRKRGTTENRKAGDFLFQKMKDYGYEVSFQEFDGYRTTNAAQFFNDFSNRNPNKEEPIFRGRNIISKRPDFDTKKPTVIYSAHYDTTTDNIGALDNGAGVCSLLEVARILSKAELPYNIQFIFFDSEEYYLQGSRHFVYALSEEEMKNIYANFNVDMVGNEKARSLIFVGKEEGELYLHAKDIFKDRGVQFSIWGQSDDMSFEKRKMRAIRYTSVDTFSKEFEPKIWTKEEDRSWVSIDRLVEDIDIIGTYAIKLEVK